MLGYLWSPDRVVLVSQCGCRGRTDQRWWRSWTAHPLPHHLVGRAPDRRGKWQIGLCSSIGNREGNMNLAKAKLCNHRIRFNFRGLNFHGFRGSTAIRESLIPQKFRPVWQRVCGCKTIASQKCKKWQRFAKATWYAAKNLRQSNWLHQYDEDSEETTNQRIKD